MDPKKDFENTNGPIPGFSIDPVSPTKSAPNAIPTRDSGPLDMPSGLTDIPGRPSDPAPKNDRP